MEVLATSPHSAGSVDALVAHGPGIDLPSPSMESVVRLRDVIRNGATLVGVGRMFYKQFLKPPDGYVAEMLAAGADPRTDTEGPSTRREGPLYREQRPSATLRSSKRFWSVDCLILRPEYKPVVDSLLPEAPTELSLDAADATSSATDSGVDTPRQVEKPPASKKRKATYYVRKDAIESLQEQVKQLQEELARAKSTSTAELREAQRQTLEYERLFERNNLLLAGSDAVLSAYKLSMSSSANIPLKMYIHLPEDADSRHAVLRALRKPKLDASLRFMTERLRHLDLRLPHKQGDEFHLPNGDIISVGSDVTPFTSGHSVRQVYDAFIDFVTNQEISISERTGVLTIREHDEIVDFKFGQSRFLATVAGGIEIETNAAMFATFVEATDSTAAYAVAAMDTVDVDDLYPYRPDSCGRKELTTVATIVETVTPTGRVVSLCKWGHVRLRMPTIPMTERDVAAAREPMHLSEIMVKVMKERLAMQQPEV